MGSPCWVGPAAPVNGAEPGLSGWPTTSAWSTSPRPSRCSPYLVEFASRSGIPRERAGGPSRPAARSGGDAGMAELLILCYHAVSEKFPASLSVSPHALREQLRTLVRRGYRGATFSGALAQTQAGKTLVVTFDDAYRSVLSLGLPILAELGLPATVFAPTAYIGTERPMGWDGIARWHQTPHEDELLPCSWHELEKLVNAGWEVGSHTRTH